MGVERLQPQTTPLKRPCFTSRQPLPLQNVPLNLTSPNKYHTIQPQMKQTQPLPLPVISSNLIVLENAPKHVTSAEQLITLQNHHQPQIPQFQGSVSPKYGVVDINSPLLQGMSNFADIRSSFTTPPRKIFTRVTEEQDTLLGALALVELSQSPQ